MYIQCNPLKFEHIVSTESDLILITILQSAWCQCRLWMNKRHLPTNAFRFLLFSPYFLFFIGFSHFGNWKFITIFFFSFAPWDGIFFYMYVQRNGMYGCRSVSDASRARALVISLFVLIWKVVSTSRMERECECGVQCARATDTRIQHVWSAIASLKYVTY